MECPAAKVAPVPISELNGATFYIPTEDQWYKAAYYKGGGTTAGYWDYATRSDTAPTKVNATIVGTGTSGGVSPVTSGNFANYGDQAGWNDRNGYVTTVGTNGVSSAYGAFDMNGNITEWNDLTGLVAGSRRGLRGGFWGSFSASSLVSSFNQDTPASDESDVYGFRLASPVSSPSSAPEIDPIGTGQEHQIVRPGSCTLTRSSLNVTCMGVSGSAWWSGSTGCHRQTVSPSAARSSNARRYVPCPPVT